MTKQGRTVVITGASRGIGAAAARHFAELGDAVVLLARSSEEINALASDIIWQGGRALALATDVARYTDLQTAIDKTHAAFGAPDVLVNNAGVIDPIARIADSDPETWSQAVDINLKGAFYGIRAVLPSMLQQGSGIVINISSGAATNALEGWSAYCATKAGLLSLTRSVHKEYAAKGIRAVGLSPGTVATVMQTQIRESGVNPVSQLDPSVHIPPEWVAQALAYLCLDAAKKYDGGDFSLKSDEGRREAGLPGLSA